MTATTPAPAAPAAGTDACALCGAAMRADQEWCLECGAGRTTLRRAPDWRLPLAIALAVIAAAVAAFVVAVSNLGSVPPIRVVVRPTATARPTPAPARGEKASSAKPSSGLAGWPPGLDGWTVALATSDIRSVAERDARAVQRDGGVPGVLDTSRHPHMHVREFIVFSGRYPTDAAASAAAARLSAAGHAGAYPIEVAPPGGI